MLLVIRPGLLIVKDGTLRDATLLWVYLFRFVSNGRQRNALFPREEGIHTLSDQLNSPLSQWFIHCGFEPAMSSLGLSAASLLEVGAG